MIAMTMPNAMTRDDLAEWMKLGGIPPDLLCWPIRIPSECFVIRERHGVWETFYAERGLETGLATFPTEDAACRAMLATLRRYAVAAGVALRR